MPRVEAEGKVYDFPDDASESEITEAVNAMHPAPAPRPPTALPTDRPSVFTPPRPKGPTLQGPLVPLKQLADSRVGSAVAALNTVNPAAAIARKAASTPFGREVMGAMTGGPAPTGPVGNRDLLRAGLAQAEQFTSPENAALLGMTAIPGVGPALGATMGVQGAAELGTQQLPEIAGSLIGGDPQGAAAQVPAALTNAAFTAIGGRHGFNPAPGRPLAARAPEAFEVPSRFARETAVERSTEGGFDPVQRVQPGAPPVGPRPLTRDAGPLPKPAADLLAFLESDQVGRGLPHLPPPTLRRPQVTRPIPEAPATLDAQLAGLVSGDRPAVYIPPGSPVPQIPRGLDVVTLGRGPEARSMVFDPRRYTRYDASHALQSDQGIAKMLGKAVDSYPPAGAPQKAVVTRAPDGTEIDATQVDARRPDQLQAEAAAQQAKAPGADVGLEDVDFTAFERWLESQQPKPAAAPPAPAPRPRRSLSDLDAGDLPRFGPRQGKPRRAQMADILAPFIDVTELPVSPPDGRGVPPLPPPKPVGNVREAAYRAFAPGLDELLEKLPAERLSPTPRPPQQAEPLMRQTQEQAQQIRDLRTRLDAVTRAVQKPDLLAPLPPKAGRGRLAQEEPPPAPIETPLEAPARLNPFAEKAAKARERSDRMNRPTAHEQGMAEAFPLGPGFGRGSQRSRDRKMDASVSRAAEATQAAKDARYWEAQAEAFDRGEIDASGRRITRKRQERSEKRQAATMSREERIAAAKAEAAGKEHWQVRGDTYATSGGYLGGSGRRYVLSEHREAVERALAEGKPVPPEVLAEYPDLVPRPEAREVDSAREQSHREDPRGAGAHLPDQGPTPTPAVRGDVRGPQREDGRVSGGGPVAGARGAESVVRTERGTEVPTRFRVVDASELVTSHDTDLRANERYPQELQPRDRGRAASEDQVQRISSMLDPERLGESRMASDGAPIVGPDLVVESGNGRTLGIRRAYAAGRGEGYRSWISQNAERFGVRPEDLAGKSEPVLVRERVGDVDRAAFAREANESAIAEMSAPERAVSDSRRISPEMMARFAPDESGNFMAATNRDFVRSFMETIPPSERGSFLAADGTLSATGVTRMRNAIFHSAYGDTRALERLAESTDDNVRSVTAALVAAAPDFASARAAAERGEAHAVDVAPDVVTAAETLSALRAEGMPVEMYLDQGTMFEDAVSPAAKQILRVVEQNKRSPKRLADFFRAIVDETQRAGDPRQGDMFGAAEPPSKQAVIEAAARRVAREPEPQQGKMFGLPERRAGGGNTDLELPLGARSARDASPFDSWIREDALPDGPEGDGPRGMPTSHTKMQLSGVSKLGKGENPVARREILEHLSHELDTPIRAGRLGSRRGLMGAYFPDRDVARIKSWGDLETTAHESGHAVSHKMGGWKGAPISAKTDLYVLGKQLYGAKQPAGGYFEEGFAEYVAAYLRGEDTAKKAPKFDSWFRANGDRKAIVVLDSTKALFDRWQRSSSVERGKTQIHHEPQGVRADLTRMGEDHAKLFSREQLTDKLAPLEDVTREMARERGLDLDDLKPSENPFLVATALEGNAAGIVETMVSRRMVDMNGRALGGSLADAIKPVKDRLEDFRIFAIARRALERHALGEKPGYDVDEARQIVHDLNDPKLEKALRDVTKWTDGLMEWRVQSGLLTRAEVDKIRAANPVYVPFERYFDPDENPQRGRGGSGGKGFTDQGPQIKRIKSEASAREIIDPLDALVKQAQLVVVAANKTRAARAFVDLAEATPGAAEWAEKVPIEMVPQESQLSTIAAQLERAGADLTNADMDATVQLWHQKFSPGAGTEPIVTMIRDGKREWWRVDPRAFRALTQMEYQAPAATIPGRAAGAVKRGIQMFATELNPGFWGRQLFLADPTTAAVLNRHASRNPFGAFKGLIDAGFLSEKHRTADASKFIDMGGKLAGLVASNQAEAGKIWRRGIGEMNLWTKFRNKAELLETGSRVPEFKASYEHALKRWGNEGDAFIYAMQKAKDVTTNFTRSGVQGKTWNQSVPFFNAAIQGASKLVRTFLGKNAWKPNGSGRRAAAGALTVITGPSLALWAFNKDQAWYQELSDEERDTYWWIGDDRGAWFRMRKPFQIGQIFGTLPETIAEGMLKQDPKGVGRQLERIGKGFLPSSFVPPAAQIPLELLGNFKSYPDYQRIVPPHMESGPSAVLPKDRARENTLPLAKTLGELTNTAPLKWEHGLNAFSGGGVNRVARFASDMGDVARGDRALRLADVPGLGGLIPTPRQGRSVEDLYDQLSELQQRQNSGEAIDQARLEVLKDAIDDLKQVRNDPRLDREGRATKSTNIARAALERAKETAPRMATKKRKRDLLAPF